MLSLTTGLIALSLFRVGSASSLPQVSLLGQTAVQSSTWGNNYVASYAIDGNLYTCSAVDYRLTKNPWWYVDMGAEVTVHEVQVSVPYSMYDTPVPFYIYVDEQLCSVWPVFYPDLLGNKLFTCNYPVTGRVLKIVIGYPNTKLTILRTLALCEVQVFGYLHGEQVIVEPVPKIDLRGYRSSQQSTYSENTIASMANDNDPYTCSQTYYYVSYKPWWKIDMGTDATIHSFKITNIQGNEDRLANVYVTVDGKPCGNIYRDADEYNLWVQCDAPITGRVLQIQLLDAPVYGILNLCEVEVWGYLHGERTPPPTVPKVDLIGLQSEQSSTYYDASKYSSAVAIDGDTSTCTWTEYNLTPQPWWNVTLAQEVTVHSVKITNHPNFMRYLGNVVITVDDKQCGPKYEYATIDYLWVTCPEPITGKVLKIQLMNAPYYGVLTMCEVEVWGFTKENY